MKRWQSESFEHSEEIGEWLDLREQEVQQMQVVAVTQSEDDKAIHYTVLISYWENPE